MVLIFTLFVLSSYLAASEQLLNSHQSIEDIWAVLVAGSSGYGNYRHQSDMCHAYQVLHSHGVPDSNIITMMYDDIAHNSRNPLPGTILNQPGGPNVYDGILKDYTGSTVTSKNFINVLLGNGTAMKGIGSGKVLKSGPTSHVFIYYTDHGAIGQVGFPNNDALYADDFITTIKEMYHKGLYGQMTIYLESCESGSMFNILLPDNINVYATTASNPWESSYACYWDVNIDAYLGDLYSVSWMEDSDNNDLRTKTLAEQFTAIVANTNSSHPQTYGNLSISNEVVGEFLGLSQPHTTNNKSKTPDTRHVITCHFESDAVPSLEVPYEILKHKLQSAISDKTKRQIEKDIERLLKGRQLFKDNFHAIIEQSIGGNQNNLDTIIRNRQQLTLETFVCYKEVTRHFSTYCYPLGQNDFAWNHLYVFANLCQLNISAEAMKSAMENVCQQITTGVN